MDRWRAFARDTQRVQVKCGTHRLGVSIRILVDTQNCRINC